MVRSLTAHLQRIHDTGTAINWDSLLLIQQEHLPQVYEVGFPQDISKCQYPFPRWPSSSRSRSGFHNHFNRMHWQVSIQILEDCPAPYPHCERCGCQVSPRQPNKRHYNTDQCCLDMDHWIQRETLHFCFEAIQVTIKVNLDLLESSSTFPYLGHNIAHNNSDWVDLYQNLRKL